MRRETMIRAVLLVALATGCGGGSDDAVSTDSAATAVSGVAPLAAGEAGQEVALDGASEAADAEGVAPAGSGAAEDATLPPSAALPGTERVIKEGTVSLEVAAGEFDQSYARVVEAARRQGGSVVGSTTQTSEPEGGTFGSVTVRVPVDRYEDLLLGVGDVGTIRSRSISAQDVSTEFVDLQSRQRNLEAQEGFYLRLLERAAGVPDAIAVQQQLVTITEQLEQVKGRLQFLDDRTSFSTLTVELFEPGVEGPLQVAEGAQTPSLGQFWQTARNAFVNVVGAMLVAALFIAPLLVPLLVGALLWRTLHRRPAPSAAPRPAAEEREPQLTP